MKNVVTVFMIKSEDNPSSLSEQDYMIITYIIAIINTYFENFKSKYSRNPQEFFDQLLDMSKNRSIGLHILLDILLESDPERLFKSKDFRNGIKVYQQNRLLDNDDQVVTALHDEMTSRPSVTRQDMERALRSLEKELDLVNIQGKEVIRKFKGHNSRIEFLGNPSMETLGTNSVGIKKILNNVMAIEFISKSLKNLGIVESLSLLFEGLLISVSRDREEKSYELLKMIDFHLGNVEQRVDRPDWKRYREIVSSMGNNVQIIKLVSGRMAEFMIEDPLFVLILLSIVLQKRSAR